MRTTLQTIVIATDGSEDARDAERAAVELCCHTGAALHVVHAWQYHPMVYDAYAIPLGESDYQLYEEAANATLEASVERFTALGRTPAAQHLRSGPAAVQVVHTCSELGADLLLIGSRGLGPVRRLVLGSVSEGVVHHASCPTLVIRGGAGAWPPDRIIVGDDGSDDALAAATLAAELAVLVEAHLTVAEALPQLPEPAQLPPASRDDLIVAAEEKLQHRLRALATDQATQIQVVVAIEEPAALLLGVAESEATPALIVVGSRGLGFLERLRLGSISTKVLHAAHCPILIVPPHPTASTDAPAEQSEER
jgi:nucleotide-binding universal stress UspA family protein